MTPPPTDHVARALLSRGARDHAMHLLRAAVARDPNERACAALLRAVEARPDAAVSGPEVMLDLALVDAYVGRAMLVEAHAVLHGSGLEATPDGAARARWLNTVLVPPPPNADPALVEILHHIYTGGASLALTLLDERAARGEALPDWADEKREHLRHLVLGLAQEQRDDAPEPARALPPISRDVAAKLAERDWPGARDVLVRYAAESPDDGSVKLLHDAVVRILDALTHRHHDPNPSQLRTAPMSPRMTADLNIRMGNLEEGERLYRKVVLEATADPTARQTLDDIQLLRKHLDPRTAPRPRRVTAARPLPADATPAPIVATRPTEPLQKATADVAVPTGIAEAPTPMAPIDRDEVTRRAAVGDLRDHIRASRELPGVVPADIAPARPPSAPVLPSAAPLPPTPSSVLSKKSQPLPAGGYAPGTLPGPAEAQWEEDGSTAVVKPEEEAELLLKQGSLDRALRIYEDLVRKKPWEARFAARLAELQALLASGHAHVPAEQTVRRDVSDLRYLTAASAQSVPPDDDLPARRAPSPTPPRPRPVSRTFAAPSASPPAVPVVRAAASPPAHAPPERGPATAPAKSAPQTVTVTRIVRVG